MRDGVCEIIYLYTEISKNKALRSSRTEQHMAHLLVYPLFRICQYGVFLKVVFKDIIMGSNILKQPIWKRIMTNPVGDHSIVPDFGLYQIAGAMAIFQIVVALVLFIKKR